ncbi:MAG: TIGR00730 family Rossman fold protein [Treponema sp.]|nr:TIGR00730 family Rossman fold protein [Treponema sp.]
MNDTVVEKGKSAYPRARIASVCVFCGSSAGRRPEFAAGAAAMGREIGRRGLVLVYGGGNIGTMGILARAALEAGASVTGVIPRKLYELVDHVELSELVVAEDMHERKARMTARSDAFIAMPGGIGTLDELFEAWTWRQLGYHDKPVGLLNLAGFYDGLLSFLRVVSEEGFLKASMLGDLVVETEPERLLDRLATAPPIAEPKLPERRR